MSVKPADLSVSLISSAEPIKGPVLTAGMPKSCYTENRSGFRREYGSCRTKSGFNSLESR